jgi:nitric oxide synthase-interacting protein
MDSHKKFDQCH